MNNRELWKSLTFNEKLLILFAIITGLIITLVGWYLNWLIADLFFGG